MMLSRLFLLTILLTIFSQLVFAKEKNYSFSPSLGDWYSNEEYRGPINATEEQQLFKVTSDAMEGTLNVKLLLDQNAKILGGAYITSSNVRKDFSFETLPQGIILMRQDDRDIVTLFGKDFNANTGGHINIVYLYSGITGSTGSFPIELRPKAGPGAENNEWQVLVHNKKKGVKVISSLHFVAHKFFGKTIGIKEVIAK